MCDTKPTLTVMSIPTLAKEQACFKGTVHPITCHEGTEGEYRYAYTLSLTSAPDGSGWLKPRYGCITPR